MYEELVSTCTWNKTWSPPVLDPCTATACQEIPFPPKSVGLEYLHDLANPLTLASEFAQYNPALPLEMKFPGSQFCGDNKEKLLIVGNIPSSATEVAEVVFRGPPDTGQEAFHLAIDVDREFIQRWGVTGNLTTAMTGSPGDGTTVDRDEPFVLRWAEVTSSKLID